MKAELKQIRKPIKDVTDFKSASEKYHPSNRHRRHPTDFVSISSSLTHIVIGHRSVRYAICLLRRTTPPNR